jgi:Fe-S-cluster containining protein
MESSSFKYKWAYSLVNTLNNIMSSFKCSGCGACCLIAGGKYGLPDRGDGACTHLADDNKTCTIYESRPSICRVDETYFKIKKYIPFLNQKTYNKINTKICHSLIKKYNLDDKYKIKIEDYNVEQ